MYSDSNSYSKKEKSKLYTSNSIKITKILNVINNFNIKAKALQNPLHTAGILKIYVDNNKILDHIKSFKFKDFNVAIKNTVKWLISNSKLFS